MVKLGGLQNFLLLLSIAFMNIGFFTVADTPQALATQLIRHFGITTEQIGLLYTVFAVTNLVCAILGGFLINKWGVGNSAIIMTTLIFLGTFVMFIGVALRSFNVVLIGRVIFSCGAENILTTQSTMSENWFSGRYLTVSMGLNTTLGLISAATSNWFTPLIANNYRNIATPFVFCGIVCFIGFIFAVIAAVIEFFNIDQLKPHITDYVEVTGDDETTIMNFAGDLENYKFSWGDLKNMGSLFWATSVVFSTGGITVYTLTDLMTDISQNRFAHTYLEAKNYISYIEIIVIILVPILSFIMMKIGHKTTFLVAGSVILVGSYTTMMFQPYVGVNQTMFTTAVIGVGTHFSIYLTAIEPSIALVAPKEVMSIAYGVTSVFLMIPLSVLPYICGKISIKRTPYEYQKVLYILFGLSILNIVATLILFFTDLKHGKILLLPENRSEVEIGREKTNKKFVQKSKSTSLRNSFRTSFVNENTLNTKISTSS